MSGYWELLLVKRTPTFPNLSYSFFSSPIATFPPFYSKTHTTHMQEYEFVTAPPPYMVCPLMKCVMLEPYKADCCGGLFSAKAAIKQRKRTCILCRKPGFTGQLDKHARDKIHKLRVYCPHRRRGCDWKGEISSIDRHVESCWRKNSPLETDPAQLSQ